MYSRSKRPQRIHLACRFSVIFFLILGLSIFMACSKDDQTEVQKTQKIVMPIKKSIEVNTSTPLQKEESKDVKNEQQSPLAISHKDQSESEAETASTPPETQTPDLEKQAETYQSTESLAQVSVSPTEKKQIEIPQETHEKDGFYTVEKGDSLSKISEKNIVYGNPLKWTSLFRLNMDTFKEMELSREFHIKELPEGLSLKFVTSSAASEFLSGFGKRIYSVNVLSAETSKRINLYATKLLTEGFNAYICTGTVGDKEWMRLRVGFFKSRSEAAEVGKQISLLLNGTKMWVVEISKSEAIDYCGY